MLVHKTSSESLKEISARLRSGFMILTYSAVIRKNGKFCNKLMNFDAENNKMKLRLLLIQFALVSLVVSGVAQDRNQPSARSQERITRQVRHALLMLPYFGVFDNITFKVEGDSVTLLGEVVRPTLKSDAGNSVKRIEGVEKVINDIEVLPPSPMDSRLRRQLFRAIYHYPALQKYALGVQKAIRIIVRNGRVNLEGVVDSEADKNLAGIRANSVPGIFSVTNNLQVESPK